MMFPTGQEFGFDSSGSRKQEDGAARYLLDANVFIEAKNRYYGFDFCPAFWD